MTKKIYLDEEKVIDMYLNKKMSSYVIAKEFRCSAPTVIKVLKKNNIRFFKNGFFNLNKKAPNRIISDEKKLRKLYINENKNASEIGRMFNCSHVTILNTLKRFNITRKSKSEIRKRLFLEKQLIHPMKDKKHSEDSKIQMSKTKKRLIKNGILKLKTIQKGQTYDEFYGEERAIKIKNKIFSEKNREAMLKGLMIRPTSYENKISELCVKNNLPFIYTGDGRFLIGHKNPDFINEKKKIAIEVYHNYFKIRDFGSCENYEKQRSEYFIKYGWDVIFIRTEEIEDKNWEEVCLNKINKTFPIIKQ